MNGSDEIGEGWSYRFTTVVTLFLIATGTFARAAPPVVQLARDRRALLPIVVPAEASERTRELAAVLADYLGRRARAQFKVSTGDGQTGVALGSAGRFPQLGLEKELAGEGFGADEQYVLRSHAKGLYAVGATEAAAQHAAWDLLFRLGHRQFFPGRTWEVLPVVEDFKIAVDAHERPDFAFRVAGPQPRGQRFPAPHRPFIRPHHPPVQGRVRRPSRIPGVDRQPAGLAPVGRLQALRI
jgi:hypothetical protein